MPVLAINKQAGYNYEILETWEAGLVLLGHEVKAIKAGQANLKGSYVSFRPGKKSPELYLLQANIAKYKQAGPLPDYQVDRPRHLLLNKKELDKLKGQEQEKGLTLVPLRLYTKKGLIKLAIGLAKGKKEYDKRADIKKRDIKRDLQRTLKMR